MLKRMTHDAITDRFFHHFLDNERHGKSQVEPKICNPWDIMISWPKIQNIQNRSWDQSWPTPHPQWRCPLESIATTSYGRTLGGHQNTHQRGIFMILGYDGKTRHIWSICISTCIYTYIYIIVWHFDWFLFSAIWNVPHMGSQKKTHRMRNLRAYQYFTFLGEGMTKMAWPLWFLNRSNL